MKKKTMIAAAIAMTGMLIAMTGCKGMCGMKHGEACDCEKCSMRTAQHPSGCTCDTCAAM